MLLVWNLGWCPTEFYVKNLLKNGHLEDQEDDRMILRWISGKQIVRLEGGWNLLQTMSISGLWYCVEPLGLLPDNQLSCMTKRSKIVISGHVL
jgi:hypothetical protein